MAASHRDYWQDSLKPRQLFAPQIMRLNAGPTPSGGWWIGKIGVSQQPASGGYAVTSIVPPFPTDKDYSVDSTAD